VVDDAGCLIDSAAAIPSLSSYPFLPEISETTMSFVVYSRHSTSVRFASVDCELLTRGDSRRVTRERFPAPNLPCSYGSSYLAHLPIISWLGTLRVNLLGARNSAFQNLVAEVPPPSSQNSLATATKSRIATQKLQRNRGRDTSPNGCGLPDRRLKMADGPHVG
jgi:hypothetical protein